MTNHGIGERIREAREQAGMKRLKLASDSGLSLNTIRNYEEHLTAPSIENLRLIAETLDVNVMWLIDGDRVGEEVA